MAMAKGKILNISFLKQTDECWPEWNMLACILGVSMLSACPMKCAVVWHCSTLKSLLSNCVHSCQGHWN